MLIPVLLLILASRFRSRRWLRASTLAALLVYAAFAANGCSDSSTPPEPRPEPTAGTPTGTFTIDIVGTTGTTQRTAPLFLTVE
jgi:hypothetical protein